MYLRVAARHRERTRVQLQISKAHSNKVSHRWLVRF